MNIFVYLIIVAAIGMTFEYFLKKKFKIQKREGWIYQSVHPVQKVIEISMLVSFLVVMWFVDEWMIGLMWFFTVFFSFRGFMEWKYDRESKQYILSIAFVIMYNIFIGLGVAIKVS